MEAIKLSKDEKKALLLLNQHGQDALDTMPRSRVRRALRSLESQSLVRVAWLEGGDFEGVMFTRDGKDYLIKPPVDWVLIIEFAIPLIISIIALFVSCIKR